MTNSREAGRLQETITVGIGRSRRPMAGKAFLALLVIACSMIAVSAARSASSGPSTSDRAPASVQFAMAAFRNMMGDLELKDAEKASSDRKAATTELALAVTMYKVLASQMAERKTDSVAKFHRQSCDLAAVRRQASSYDVQLPSSSHDLLVVTGKILEYVQSKLEEFDVVAAAKDATMRQAIEQQMDSTLMFLSCITTPLLPTE